MSEYESVEDIKSRMDAYPKGEAPEVEDSQESNDIVNKETLKLPLSKRLDNAYQNLNDTERQAWSQGWRPEEFFAGKRRDGSEKPFVNAEDFLNKSKDALPIANDRLREMAKELEETKKMAKEAQERISRAEEKGYQKALAEIEAKQKEAVEMGDVEEFTKLKQTEKDLIQNQFKAPEVPQNDTVVEDVMEPKKAQPSTLTPLDQQILQDWAARNNWMRTDPKLAAYAIQSEKELLTAKPYLSLNERLEIVEQEVKEVFHSKFNPTQTNPMFEGGVNKGYGSAPKEKGYSDLLPEVKKQCETLIKIRGIQGEDAIKRFKATFAKNIN